MNNACKVIINTSAQYVRTIINLCLSLYSTRLILSSLGVEDYGIYTLIAGVVYLLSFAINALVVTTQRYMSFYSGKGDITKLKEIFCNSLVIHIALGIILAILVKLSGLFLFEGFFNITPERINAAKVVFNFVILMLVLSFWSAPFRALLISHENIVYISIVDIFNGILKVLIALFIASIDTDRLILYSALLCLIQIFEFFAFSVFDFRFYSECIFPKLKYLNKNYIKEISSFAGWTIYSVGCITGRSQGVSIILNKFMGVVANASYGIALQVNGAMLFLSQSLLNALNPQIMKAEGVGDRRKMFRLSEIESKFSFLLIGMVVIPCLFEMPSLLSVWLGEEPDNAVMFCRFILLSSLVDQSTIGLGTANQAIGNIKRYSLAVNTVKLLTLAPFYICLLIGKGICFSMVIYLSFEIICSMMRLFLLRRAGLSIKKYIEKVFVKELFPILSTIVVSMLIVCNMNVEYRFVITILASICVMAISVMIGGLCPDEKQILKAIISNLRKR